MPSPTKSVSLRVSLLLIASSLTACASTVEKFEQVGKPPEMSKVDDPSRRPDAEPISWPTPTQPPPSKEYAGSLWQPGSRAFFRDQRAGRVGDILKVNIKIKDKAEIDNETERKRDTADNAAVPQALGLQDRLFKPLPGEAIAANMLDATSKTNTKGTGSVKREEKIETQVAVLVTQVLPNGNLVVDGKQEIRVNYDVREVAVKGVVRPQDIRADNTVDSTQIAEARIVYGGRGQIMDVQQPRWGSQVMDAVLPF